VRVFYYFVFCFQNLLFEWGSHRYPINGWRMFVLQFAIWFRLLFSLTEIFVRSESGGPRDWALWAVAGIVGVAVYMLLERQHVYENYAREFRGLSKTQRILANIAVCAFSVVALLSPFIARGILYGRPWWS